MTVGMDHPEVVRFLARLEVAAAGLPPGRREELVAELREHLADALQGAADEVAVRELVDRLGAPEDIVAAEGLPVGLSTGPGPGRDFAPVPTSRWGPLEIAAVGLLTVGSFLLPIFGPVAGLVCAWISQQWTHRQKIIATVWTVMQPIVLALALSGVVLFSVPVGEGEISESVEWSESAVTP